MTGGSFCSSENEKQYRRVNETQFEANGACLHSSHCSVPRADLICSLCLCALAHPVSCRSFLSPPLWLSN